MQQMIDIQRLSAADIDRLLPFVVQYHVFEQIDQNDDDCRAALLRLLSDATLGTIYAIKVADAWIGYIALCFGYSIELGGREAFVDEFFIAPKMRGHGYGGDVLDQVMRCALEDGIKVVHLEVARDNVRAQDLYIKKGFAMRSKFGLMTLDLASLTNAQVKEPS